MRMCAPSMPLPAEPSTRLSRVVPQDACLTTSTSGMPCLANGIVAGVSESSIQEPCQRADRCSFPRYRIPRAESVRGRSALRSVLQCTKRASIAWGADGPGPSRPAMSSGSKGGPRRLPSRPERPEGAVMERRSGVEYIRAIGRAAAVACRIVVRPSPAHHLRIEPERVTGIGPDAVRDRRSCSGRSPEPVRSRRPAGGLRGCAG